MWQNSKHRILLTKVEEKRIAVELSELDETALNAENDYKTLSILVYSVSKFHIIRKTNKVRFNIYFYMICGR